MTRLLGFIIVFCSMGAVFYFEGQSSHSEGILRVLHWPALCLTGLGPIGMVLLCYDGKVLARTLRYLTLSTVERQELHEREARMLHRVGTMFYEEGPSAFEKVPTNGVSEMAQKVLERLAVRIPNNDILDMLSMERDRTLVRLVQTLNVVGLGVKLSPSIGMLGTILGMVNLLSTLQDPTRIGSAMSLALLTTFYGLFFSIVIWTPLQQRLERTLDLELEGFDQTIRWLELLDKRKPSEYFADAAELPTPSQNAA